MSGRDLMGGDTIPAGELLTALAELDIELIATLSAAQLAAVPDLPANVRAVEFVPLNELLPTCAAVIHHGGFGTVMNVLAHGVPTLTIPAPWWDEADLGRHLAEGGAGITLDAGALTAGGVRAALERLLSDASFTRGAERMRTALLDVPSPSGLVPELERRTALHRSRRRAG
jgi:UDP:flavonoid glycosyltransferase YjiC (YdhE family)